MSLSSLSLLTKVPRAYTVPASIGALLLSFCLRGVAFNRSNSQAFDEAVYIASGYSYLMRKDFRLNPEHPPLAKLVSALPVYLVLGLPFEPNPGLWEKASEYAIGQEFLYDSRASAERILTLARLPGLLLGMGLVSLVGLWSYRLWGSSAAIIGVGLAACDPNLIAHSSLGGTDFAPVLFIFLTLYLLWENRSSPSPWLVVTAGVSTGLAIASKYSSLILLPAIGLLMASHLAVGGFLPFSQIEATNARGRIGPRLISLVVITYLSGTAAVMMVVLCYLGTDPLAWWRGLEWQLRHHAVGHEEFFLGKVSKNGWYTYFIVSFFLKTPIGSLFLILTSLLTTRTGSKLGARDAGFLIVPAALLLGAMTVLKADLGIRYILPIYPFLYVIAARGDDPAFDPTGLCGSGRNAARMGHGVVVERVAPRLGLLQRVGRGSSVGPPLFGRPQP